MVFIGKDLNHFLDTKKIMNFQTLVDASAQWFLVLSVPILSINTYNYVKLKQEPRHCELI